MPEVIRALFAQHNVVGEDAEGLWAGFVARPDSQFAARARWIFESYLA